jgi:diguanylate cyclase (GGDEF)-like protein
VPQVRARSIETSVLLAGVLHAAVAGVLYVVFLRDDAAYAVGPDVAPLVLVVAFFGCELVALRIERMQGESYGFTLALVPMAVGFAYVAPGVLLAARLSGAALALVVAMVLSRQRKVREAVYEVAVHALQVVPPVMLFRLLIGNADVVGVHGAFALLLALLASFAMASVALTVCVGIVQGRIPNGHTISVITRTGAVAALLNAAIGIGLTTALWDHPHVLLVLTAIVLAGIICNRAYRGLLHRYKGLETHYDFVSSVVRSSQLSEVTISVLAAARKLLRADDAVLLLRPVDEGEPARRVRLGDAGRELADVLPAQHMTDLRSLMPGAEPCRVAIDDSSPQWLRALTGEHAMAAPLTSTDRSVVGALVVTQARRRAVGPFGNADADLLGSLAQQASIAIENGILFHRLAQEAAERAHQATHDPVTGLPNRARLEDLVGRALDAAYPTRGRVGLLVVDLDSFGQVVDAFGHSSADGLLIQACGRIRGLVAESAILARLGGEQFAIVLPGVGDRDEVIRTARLLIAGFDPPFQSEGVLLALSVNVGIAVYPEQAIDVPSLIQRAHIAADVASQHRSGWELYDATHDPSTPRRLALAADLREALETDGLDVCFQPKVELATGVVRGAEALVRWNHPRLGRVRPDEFIAIAEHTGDIRALTMVVMRKALRECRGWRDFGLDMSVAVNLSARNLLDLHLVDDVAAAIDEAGVPPSALTLELTESVVMAESQRSFDVLSGLNDLGVRLSCDDFGTGYSSLAHLRRLPICEIKIDKSFIARIAVDESDRAIARSVLTLGRDLGLATVAEGVESREGWDLLAQLGCDQAQGFVVCPPLTGPQFGEWLGRRPPDEFAYLDDRYADEIAAYQRRMLPSLGAGEVTADPAAEADEGAGDDAAAPGREAARDAGAPVESGGDGAVLDVSGEGGVVIDVAAAGTDAEADADETVAATGNGADGHEPDEVVAAEVVAAGGAPRADEAAAAPGSGAEVIDVAEVVDVSDADDATGAAAAVTGNGAGAVAASGNGSHPEAEADAESGSESEAEVGAGVAAAPDGEVEGEGDAAPAADDQTSGQG